MSDNISENTVTDADRGDPEAQYTLGQWYYRSAQHRFHKEEGLRLIKLSAEAGNAEAQTLLGSHYDWPPGTEDLAEYWFEKAAAQGHGWGCYLLAQFRFSEIKQGVGKYSLEGVELLRRAASSSFEPCPEAHVQLGRCLAVGEGVELNKVEAFAWLSVAKAEGWYGWQDETEKLLPKMTRDELRAGKALAADYISKYQCLYN